jgi:hypothetical protein
MLSIGSWPEARRATTSTPSPAAWRTTTSRARLPAAGDELLELQELARGSISTAFTRHYSGFFHGCQREHLREPTAKTMHYTYRVALTGIHLLRTGALQPDVTVLAPEFGYDDVAELVELKRAGTARSTPGRRWEHGGLAPDLDEHHRQRWPQLEQALVDAERDSPLPTAAPNEAEIEAWLVRARLADLASSA